MLKVHITLHDQAKRNYILKAYKRIREIISGKFDFPPALPPTVLFNEISISHYAFLPKAKHVKFCFAVLTLFLCLEVFHKTFSTSFEVVLA